MGCIEGDYRLIASEKLISQFLVSMSRLAVAMRIACRLTISAILLRSGAGLVGSMGVRSRARSLAVIILLSTGLSGCIAAAVPLMMGTELGAVAFSGFEVYKTVQLSSGGSVGIEFPGKDGKTNPPRPLDPATSVAIWPGDEGDVHFAERMAAAGKKVSSPAVTAGILSSQKLPSDLKQMTQEEQRSAFGVICRQTRTQLVFAARSDGETSNTNTFSFSSANITFKAHLMAYSCSKNAVIWEDDLAAVVKLGGSAPATAEINRAASDAWADRVLQAMGTNKSS